MKNAATIAICHLVVLRTYVGVAEPYALGPACCGVQEISPVPSKPPEHQNCPKPPAGPEPN